MLIERFVEDICMRLSRAHIITPILHDIEFVKKEATNAVEFGDTTREVHSMLVRNLWYHGKFFRMDIR